MSTCGYLDAMVLKASRTEDSEVTSRATFSTLVSGFASLMADSVSEREEAERAVMMRAEAEACARATAIP